MRALLVAMAIAPSALAQFDPAQFGYLPFKMLNDARDPFGYYFDARSSSPAGLQLSVVQSATQSAWKKWDDISCASTAFRFLGPTTNVVPDPADPYDVYNVSTVWVSSRQDPVYQAALGVSVSAVTLPLTYAGVLQQCDIYLNAADFAWSTTTPTPSGSSDVETLVLHEVGHCQGLDHTNVDLADVMYPVAPVGAQKRALQPRDAAQLCYRYPASNGLGSPCDGGTGSCGTGSLKCVPVAQPDGGVKHMCSQGCALMQGGQCDIPFVCTASSAFSPQYAGACLPPDNSVTQVGKPCTQSSQCGSANAICFLENQPNPLPSGAPAWKDGYCTHNCGTGQPGCPAGSACLDIGGGQLFQMRGCFLHGPRDVPDVLFFADEAELEQPHGLFVGGAFRYRAARAGIIAAKLRAVVRRGMEQVAAVDGLVEASVAGNAFSLDGGGEQVAVRRRAAGFRPVLENVAVHGGRGHLRLRRQQADGGQSAHQRLE